MKRLNKSMFLFVSVWFFAVLLSVDVFAFTGKGKGTEESPYVITTFDQFLEIENDLSAHYAFENDIEKGSVNFSGIGDWEHPFTGVLDGKGFKIRASVTEGRGLFYSGDGATVKNLFIYGGTSQSDHYEFPVGVLFGSLSKGNVENCYIDGSVNGPSMLGGIAGSVYDSVISNCYVDVSIRVGGYPYGMEPLMYTGGIAGYASNTKIENCTTTGSIWAYMALENSGGIVGKGVQHSEVINCSSNMRFDSVYGEWVGGLSNGAYLRNSYYTGEASFTYTEWVGALGSSYYVIDDFDSVYFKDTPFWNSLGQYENGKLGNTTEELMQKSTYKVWDWDIWEIDENYSYPHLKTLDLSIASKLECPELSIESLEENKIEVKWVDNQKNSDSSIYYKVQYGDKTVLTKDTSVVISDFEKIGEYIIKVRKCSPTSYSKWSNEETVWIGPPPLGNISQLQCTGRSPNSVTLSWEPVQDATEYEIKYEDKLIKTQNTQVTLEGLNPATQYSFLIRGISNERIGRWSEIIVKTLNADGTSADSTKILTNVQAGLSYEVVFAGDNLSNFADKTFTISYDPDKIEIIDLYALTPEVDMELGVINGTDIEVISISNEKIEFKINKSIAENESWTGIITIIKFKALESSDTTIEFYNS